jgi:hypothetical protein
MNKPEVVEVRFKMFEELDYVSGTFYIFALKDTPEVSDLIQMASDKNEITIRLLSEKDMLTLGSQLVNDEEVDMLYEMFEIDPFENVTIMDSDIDDCDISQIEVFYINNVDNELKEYYKEKKDEQDS